MKAETADYLAKARATLADARQIAALPLPHVAGREAYYAAFHAAEAYIFEHTGKVATTHKGVRIEFARLVRREPRIDRQITRFLTIAYQLKATANYGIGPTAAPVDDSTLSVNPGNCLEKHLREVIQTAAQTPASAAAAPLDLSQIRKFGDRDGQTPGTWR